MFVCTYAHASVCVYLYVCYCVWCLIEKNEYLLHFSNHFYEGVYNVENYWLNEIINLESVIYGILGLTNATTSTTTNIDGKVQLFHGIICCVQEIYDATYRDFYILCKSSDAVK